MRIEQTNKTLSVLLIFFIIMVFTTGCSAQAPSTNASSKTVITLQIANTMISVNGEEKEIDPGRKTVPVIIEGRTLLPVRAVVEAMGAKVEWDDEKQTVKLTLGDSTILLTNGSNEAFLNETAYTLDVVPVVIDGRIMFPIRFIAEGFGYDVDWDQESQIVTLTQSQTFMEDESMNKITIEVNGHNLTATLEENSSSEALLKLLGEGSITIEMQDYGNFEKVGNLGASLPRNDERITTQPGDLILYQGDQITIYYDVNTWNFTKLGKIDNVTQNKLEQILGTGSVTVTLSLYNGS